MESLTHISKFSIPNSMLRPCFVDPTARPPVPLDYIQSKQEKQEMLEFMIVDYLVTDAKIERIVDYSHDQCANDDLYANIDESASSADARDIQNAKNAIARKHAILEKKRIQELEAKIAKEKEKESVASSMDIDGNESVSDGPENTSIDFDNDDNHSIHSDDSDSSNEWEELIIPDEVKDEERTYEPLPKPSPDTRATAYLFGVTKEGHSVCVHSPFRPYFFLEIPKGWQMFPEGDTIKKILAPEIGCDEAMIAVEMVKRKKTFGYHPDDHNVAKDKVFNFFKMSFPSVAHMKKADEHLSRIKHVTIAGHFGKQFVTVHESRVNCGHKFMDEKNIVSSGWVRVNLDPTMVSLPRANPDIEIDSSTSFKYRELGFKTHCQIEMDCKFSAIHGVAETDPLSDCIPPLVIASFDIEVYSPTNQFPNPNNPECVVTAISTVYARFGFPNERFKIEYALKPIQMTATPEPPQDKDTDYECTELRYFDHEKDLLAAWRDLMVLKIDPDIVIGYNIKDFDLSFLATRVTLFEPLIENFQLADGIVYAKQRYFYQSRFIKYRTPVISRSVSTAAKGDRTTKSMIVPGRVIGDVYLHMKDGYKMKKLKLDDVAHEVLGKRKIPLNHEDHFALYKADIFNPKIRKMFWGLNPYIAVDVITKLGVSGTIDASTIHQEIIQAENRLENAERAYKKLKASTPDSIRTRHRDDIIDAEKHLEKTRESLGDLVRTSITEFKKSPITPTRTSIISSIERMLRRRLSEYCAVDALLPLLLTFNKMTINNMIEMSRLCCTSLSDIETRGQQIKVFSLIVTFAHRAGYIVSNVPKEFKIPSKEKYQGATVLEPTVGYYIKPVATLDFASLYPTIMRNNNLCFSTLLTGEQNHAAFVNKLKAKGVDVKTFHVEGKDLNFILDSKGSNSNLPTSKELNSTSGKRGILPEILDRLVASRARVKKLMKNYEKKATDADRTMYAILDARQLALKVSCNSVYGFTGVNPAMAMLPCRPVAMCTTAEGRNMIETSKNIVNNVFPKLFPEECIGINPTVIYGDTDSVMIHFEGMEKRVVPVEGEELQKDETFITRAETDVEYMQRVFDIATHMGEYISQHFKDHGGAYTDLAFEKVYFPYLLMKKKNYIGLKYEGKAEWEPKIDMKGIDIVKRSVCGFVQQAASSLIGPLMYQRSEDLAAHNLYSHIKRLMNNQVPLEDYCHYTKMSASYKNGGANLPQVRVRDQQRARNPGSEAKAGDYVSFIVHEVKGKDPAKLKVYQHVEDFAYCKENDIKADRYYILSNKLRNLVNKILQFTSIKVDDMLREPLLQLTNSMMGRQDISSFFKGGTTNQTNFMNRDANPIVNPISNPIVTPVAPPISDAVEIDPKIIGFKRKPGELSKEAAKKQKKDQQAAVEKTQGKLLQSFFAKK